MSWTGTADPHAGAGRTRTQRHPEPSPSTNTTSRTRSARLAAHAWKVQALGVEADGVYGAGQPLSYVLPAEQAARNLLPEANGALAFFSAHGLAWHRSVAHGPTNNLLSSQVQCVNALFRMTDDKARLRRAFGGTLDIADVEPIDGDALLTFEYVGPGDLFDEAASGGRTPVDAAFRYRQAGGARALALIEWKYTESYFATSRKHNDLYRSLWLTPDGPLVTAERHEGELRYETSSSSPSTS